MLRIEFTDGAFITAPSTHQKVELGTVLNVYLSPKSDRHEREAVLLCAFQVLDSATPEEKKMMFRELFGVCSDVSHFMDDEFINGIWDEVAILIRQRYNDFRPLEVAL